ncbi:MAG: hypothetical protein LC778_14030 [Acidobacteria bacterium]|nr:hypothetical protein [Acidobacteriota bacterium]
MRFWSKILLFTVSLFLLSCAEEPSTPLKTFKAYTRAIKQKDTTTMKLLLSEASIKMHEQEAKAQNVNLDEIVKRETLFTEDQKSVKHRNEKIEGGKATLEVENSLGVWETIPFVREDGVWKIDKQGFANQIFQQTEENNKRLDDIINQRQP